jgi:1-aminocyclopropane-1-carboxylate deaminase/D-cysteine desulfhydrase-like pyridoxal-dependent ACC family enzyme
MDANAEYSNDITEMSRAELMGYRSHLEWKLSRTYLESAYRAIEEETYRVDDLLRDKYCIKMNFPHPF